LTDVLERVSGGWLAGLAGPLVFGVAGPILIMPRAAGDLHVSLTSVAGIVAAFGWAVAVGTPMTAWLLGTRGTRATLLVCGLLTLAGAGVVLMAPSLVTVLVGVVLEGLGAAGFFVTALHLAGSAKTVRWVTASQPVGGAVAPLLGSFVATTLSWHATLALPALSLLFLPVVFSRTGTDHPAVGRFDPVGAALLMTVVTALVVSTDLRSAGPIVVAVVVAAAGVVLLGTHTYRHPDGFVPLAAIRTGDFRVSVVLMFVLSVTNFAILYGAGEILPRRFGWSSGEVGAAMIPPSLLAGVAAWCFIPIVARAAPRLVAGGLFGAAVAAVLMTCVSDWAVLFLIAVGVAAVTVTIGLSVLMLRAVKAVSPKHHATTGGLVNLGFQLGVAFGPVIATLLSSR
jgi:MFS family permease